MTGMTEPPTVTASVLAPLGSEGRAEGAAQRIAAAIALGLFTDGDQLPSEAELATQLGVATVTLREALSALREQGLVETRRGRTGGTFVRIPRAEAARIVVRRLARLRPDELRDLGDEHLAIAGTAASLAAGRAGSEALGRLEDRIAELAAAETHWHQCRADSHFHVEIAIAAGSRRLVEHEVRLQAETVEYLWVTEQGDPDLASAIRSHREILAAIAAGDPDRARQVAQKHITKNVGYITALRDRVSRSAS